MAFGQTRGFGHSIGLGAASDWVDPRRQQLLGLAAGLMQGPDIGSGLAQGFQYAAQGRQADDAYATQQKAEAERQKQIADAAALKDKYANFFMEQNRPDIAQGIADGIVEPGAAYMDFITPKDVAQNEYDSRAAAGQEYGLTGEDLNTFVLTGSLPGTAKQNVTYGVTPIMGTDSVTGKTGMGVQGSDGSFKVVDTGSFVPLNPYDKSAMTAAGRAFGNQTGAAQFDVPSAKLIADQSLKAIEDIRAEKKGMDEQFGTLGVSTPFGDIGIPQQMTPAWPKSDKAKFQVAVQRGTDRAFLEAREMLRGGGQITDFESRKAETAITSMQIAMEKGDKAQFEKALDDFEQAVKDGVTKLEMQANAMPGFGNGGAAPSGGSDYKSKYGLE